VTVLVFPKLFKPSDFESKRLAKYQKYFEDSNTGIWVDVKFDKYKYVLRRQALANHVRGHWRLIIGGREYPITKILKGY